METVGFIIKGLISFKNLSFVREDDYETSDGSSASSSSSSYDDDEDDEEENEIRSRKNKKIAVTFLESLSNYVPFDDKHTDAKQYVLLSLFLQRFVFSSVDISPKQVLKTKINARN